MLATNCSLLSLVKSSLIFITSTSNLIHLHRNSHCLADNYGIASAYLQIVSPNNTNFSAVPALIPLLI